jgi:hypothetical protein
MRVLIYFTFLCFVIQCPIHANDEWDASLQEKPLADHASRGPLFVSLGSTCEVSHEIRHLNLRVAAFPFDWIGTIDYSQLSNIFVDNFAHFFDEKFLVPWEKNQRVLLNTYYSLVFPHEGDWSPQEFKKTFEKFKIKFQRRIKRFNEISNYPGKVFFLRNAWPYPDDLATIFKDSRNNEISDEIALELYQTLKNKFPTTDFTLVIINKSRGTEVLQSQISENIIKMNFTNIDIPTKLDLCKRNFIKLMVDFGYSDTPIFQDLLNSLNN